MQLTQGSQRAEVRSDTAAELRAAGVLIEDQRRQRPRYFDGRFLAARDLIRDQQYFLTREADLGQAAGSGVAAGLFVQEDDAPQTLRVLAGHGLTPGGELVLLPRDIRVALADIPMAEQLSARFGLSRLPQPPMRARTGLFVLALRPVEFTANPIGAYPTSLTGQRTVEDGDVIEATAVVLVPWPDDGGDDALEARRGRAARAIFTQGAAAGVASNVLPLAMLALRNNTVEWIDEALVRRELGADRGDLPGLGFSPRGLRLAHLMQYQAHLADLQARGVRGFAASAHFAALPPAGPLPDGVLDAADFSQRFFPPEVDVDFSLIPEDELPALVEEALALQPIDLTATGDQLDSTAVMVVAPIPRAQWRAVAARLGQGGVTPQRTLKPAAPNLVAQRRPLEVLQQLRFSRASVLGNVLTGTRSGADVEWQRLLRGSGLWFVRRRHLAHRDDLVGSYREVVGNDEREVELRLNERIEALGLRSRLDPVLAVATPSAATVVIGLLAGKRLQESPALTAAALGLLADSIATTEVISGQPALDKAAALGVSAVVGEPEKNAALTLLLKREAAGEITEAELLRIASNAEWNEAPVDEGQLEKQVFQRLESIGLAEPATFVVKRSEPAVNSALLKLLSTRRFAGSGVLSAAALGLLVLDIERLRALTDPVVVSQVGAALADTSRSALLTEWLTAEARRPLPPETFMEIVKVAEKWAPDLTLVRPRGAPAVAKRAAPKAVSKKTAPAKSAAKTAVAKTAAPKSAASKGGTRRRGKA
jgi:hypothetical protein